MKTEDKFVAMVHHATIDQKDKIFVADEQNVFSIDAVEDSVANILTLDYRQTSITQMVGRYSMTVARILLYLSDLKGCLHIFDPDEYEIKSEKQLFTGGKSPKSKVIH